MPAPAPSSRSFVLALAALFTISAVASAYPPDDLKTIKTHHGSSTLGARYCKFPHWLCLPTLGPGPAHFDDFLAGYGDQNGDLTNDPSRPGGLALHLRFLDAPDYPADSLYQANDTLLAVGDSVAALMHASAISIEPGRYPYLPAASTYGDIYLSARVVLPPAPFDFVRRDYGTGNTPIAVAIGDLNRDGIPDLVAANVNANTVSVLLGYGDGTFAPQVEYATAGRPYDVAIGDLNGDGKPDLAIADELYPGGISVLLGNGDGTFAPRTDFATGSNTQTVAIGDFNGDGHPDLVGGHYYSNLISVLFGDGTGSFGPHIDFGTGSGPGSLAVGDFNGDGIPDIVTANGASGTFSIWLADGAGDFTRSDIDAGPNPNGPAVADFDGDGILDLATPHYYQNSISFRHGNGDGTFAAALDYPTGAGPGAIAAGDLNGDGNPDIVTTSQVSGGPNYVSVLLGDGAGHFAPRVDFGTGDYPIGVALGDLTGDIRLEVVCASHLENKLTVLINTGGYVGVDGPASSSQFVLRPVFPNPGHNVAAITFELPRTGHVRLSVLDVLGREVAKLADDDFTAGVHTLHWSAISRVGPVPAGVYWARCEADGRSLSQRVVIRR